MNRPPHRPSRRTFMLAAALALITLLAGFLMVAVRKEPKAAPARVAPLANTRILPRTAPPDVGQKLGKEVSGALGFTDDLPTEVRIRQLMNTTGKLTDDELEELTRALLSPPGHDETLAEHSTWFHEIANLLQRQESGLRSFAEVLATVARDATRDPATRDYALQHLRRVWDKAAADPGLRPAIEATFGEMTATGDPMRQTALLSLHLLDPAGGSGMETTLLVENVLSILKGGKETGNDAIRSRMVAARIAGERRLAGSRGALLELATAESEHALVRMAAISALGRFAEPSDLDALARLSPKDERVAGAIRRAAAMSAGK